MLVEPSWAPSPSPVAFPGPPWTPCSVPVLHWPGPWHRSLWSSRCIRWCLWWSCCLSQPWRPWSSMGPLVSRILRHSSPPSRATNWISWLWRLSCLSSSWLHHITCWTHVAAVVQSLTSNALEKWSNYTKNGHVEKEHYLFYDGPKMDTAIYIYIYATPPTRTPHFDWFTSIFVWREMLEE